MSHRPEFGSVILNNKQIELKCRLQNALNVLADVIEQISDSKETAIAFTKLEECSMWAMKALAWRYRASDEDTDD